ncbi:protein kinase family protein [Crossiella sp. CA-258035]|uniref:protein kinase family protein n=1 Tax=Crossiella sp. CA-258035 TaxID=2981138 RepID=UPI0024BBEF82|nr:protein kinase family protein [Crossiella sp. CA-258035]WHT19505.1 protein kinase family protein [Crossiella sp. CA-258035]
MSGTPDYTAPHGNPAGGAVGAAAFVPGATLGDGRYRLLSLAGQDVRAPAQFWRARDNALGRDVALTVLIGDASDEHTAARARRTLERSTHGAGFTHPGVSRTLDVLWPGHGVNPRDGVLGIIVAEWTQGTDLLDLITEGPLPSGTASRLLEALAAAVETAHHAGLVLGVDHPQRLRVTPDGKLRLAFPGPRAEVTAREDVRGLGAVLYLMLTCRWALDGGPHTLPSAPTGPDGTVVSPQTLHPTVPHELSTVAVRSLVDTSIGGLRTGAAILRVLEQTAAAEAEAAALRAQEAALTEEYSAVGVEEDDKRDEKSRRRKLAVGMTLLTVATVGILAWIGLSVIGMFATPETRSGPTVALTPTTTAPPAETSNPVQPSTPPSSEPVQAGGTVDVASVNVYNVQGEPDNPHRIKRVVDGDPRSTWKTMTYRQQFPRGKPGVGVMITLSDAAKLAKVVIDSPSAGTKVEVRSAPSGNADLDATTVLGSGTLQKGDTEIALNAGDATKFVLLWITGLGGSGDRNVSELSELTFVRAG